MKVPRRVERTDAERISVIEDAVEALGALALAGPGARLNAQQRHELNHRLFECLEVLNDEKVTYRGDA